MFFFLRLPTQGYHCVLSLSDVAIIELFLLSLSRRQSFPGRQEHFFDSGHLWVAASIMIISNISNEPLAQLVVK